MTLAAVELGLRWAGPRSPVFDPRLTLYPFFRIERSPAIRGLAPHAFYTTNSLGLRGSEPPRPFSSAYSIVAVGGSTTMCALNDDAASWPAVLERTLNEHCAFDRPAWVANAGIDGQTSVGHRVVMEHVVGALRPDAVILLVGLNDASLCLSGRPSAGTYDEWLLRDARDGWLARLVQSSRLLQFLWLEDRIRARRVTPGFTTHVEERYPVIERDRASNLPGDAADAVILGRLGLPDTIAARYEENLRALVRAGRSSAGRVVFLSQPVLYGPGAVDYEGRLIDLDRDGSFRWIQDANRVFTYRDIGLLVTYLNRVTERTARAEGAEFFDLAAAVPRHQKYFYDGYHFTDEGSALVGRAIGAYFLSAARDSGTR